MLQRKWKQRYVNHGQTDIGPVYLQMRMRLPLGEWDGLWWISTSQEMENRDTERVMVSGQNHTFFWSSGTLSDCPWASETTPSICVRLTARWMLSFAWPVSEQDGPQVASAHLELWTSQTCFPSLCFFLNCHSCILTLFLSIITKYLECLQYVQMWLETRIKEKWFWIWVVKYSICPIYST